MKRQISNPILILIPASLALGLILFIASGCINLDPQHDPTRIFVLSGNSPKVPAEAKEGLAIIFKRIELPSYLDSPKMATRQGDFEIIYSEFNRWGEDLDKAIGRLLADNLLAHPRIREVTLFPSNQAESDYKISLNISRFEGINKNAAVLEARWKIFNTETGETVETGITTAHRPWDGKDYTALTRSLSDTLAELGRDISRALDEVSDQP